MGGGVVVCGTKLPDYTVDLLAFELSDLADFLVIGKPSMLDLCENKDIYKFNTPVSPGELTGAVNILIQKDQHRSRIQTPQRTPEDNELISRAKELLMKVDAVTEEQAHRYLQKKSMTQSMRMADVAKQVIRTLGKNEAE